MHIALGVQSMLATCQTVIIVSYKTTAVHKLCVWLLWQNGPTAIMPQVHTVQLLGCSQCLAPAMRDTHLKDVLRSVNKSKAMHAAVEPGSMPNRVAVGVPVVKPLGSKRVCCLDSAV